jgi:hypothetical protein
MLERTAAHLPGQRVKGWLAETTSLDRPPELASRTLALGLGVTHHRRQGAAWGRFMIFILTLDESLTGRGTARPERGGAG